MDKVQNDRRQRILNFLKENQVGVLATVEPNSTPHASTIFYTIDENFTVSFITKTNTEKYKNIQHQPQVCLLVYEAPSQTTATIMGTAVEVSDITKMQEVFVDIVKAAHQVSGYELMPITKLQAGAYIAYQIQPKQADMIVYSRPTSGNNAELKESILF